jgi:putative phage-type endonuclease
MIDVIQGTPEWHELRRGKVTASRVADVVAKTKSGPSALRANYMAELIAERLSGTPAEAFISAAMQWGTDMEPQVGFVIHPTIVQAGASPDGLVNDDGLIEIKCPNTATHLETLLGQAVPAKYETQMQFQMACTGRQWCDFVSYDPRMPESMRLFIKRVERDDKRIKELETEIAGFLLEVAVKLSELNSLYGLEMEAA